MSMKNWSEKSERACGGRRWGWPQTRSIPVCGGFGRQGWPHPLRCGNCMFLSPSKRGCSRWWGQDHVRDATVRPVPYGVALPISSHPPLPHCALHWHR